MLIKFIADYEDYKAGEVREAPDNLANLYIKSQYAVAIADKTEQELRAEVAQEVTDLVRTSIKDIVEAEAKKTAPAAKVVEPEIPFGEVLRALAKEDHTYIAKWNERTAAGMNETTPGDGGAWVMQQNANELIEKAVVESNIASRCDVVPIGRSNSVKIPAIGETSRTYADGVLTMYGGVAVYPVAEADNVTLSKFAADNIELTLKKFMAAVPATDELIDDSIVTLENQINTKVPIAIRKSIDHQIIKGTGGNLMTGILGHAATMVVTQEDATKITAMDIDNMWTHLAPGSEDNAVWLISPGLLPYLRQINTGTQALYMPANGLADSPFGTLMGRPIIKAVECSAVGTEGDIILADLSQYAIGRKNSGIRADLSMHVYYLSAQTVYRFIYRIDGRPKWDATLRTEDLNEVSPFVTLASGVRGTGIVAGS